jgi:protein TonB
MNRDRLFYSLLSASLLAHVGFALVFDAIPRQAARYGVEIHDASMDVALVEFVEPEPEPEPVIEPEPEAIELPAPPPPRAAEPIEAPTVRESGALTQATPDYLRNPPPRYPRIARERGWRGTTLLRVEVLANGSAGYIEIAKSSGYRVLDEVSVEAVRDWKFLPATLGGRPVSSWVEVPIRFQLRRS